jgi:TMEM70/TMEM186/TMEM223 protein family
MVNEVPNELIYAGPMNKMMVRLKMFSLSTLIGSIIIAPLYLNYVRKKKAKESFKPHVFLVTGMLIGSFASTYLFHKVASKYVLRIYRFMTPSNLKLPLEKERLRLVTIDFWGRSKNSDLFVQDIEALNDGINTWRAKLSGLKFYLSIPSSLGKGALEASTANGQSSTLLPSAGSISSESRKFLKDLDLFLRSQQLVGQFKK